VGGVLAVEAFAADVAGGEVGVDFFSAAGFGAAAAGAGFEVVVAEAEVAGGFGGSAFSGFGELETFGGAAVFAAVVGTLVDGFSEGGAALALAFTGNGSGFGGGAFFASGDSFFVAG
jgi:hypothetical protein